MATIDLSPGVTTLHNSRAGNTKVPYLIENTIDWAAALTAKGSALAAADVVEVLDIPAQSLVLAAGMEVITADDATTLTLDLGITAVEADIWADGFDHAAAAAGAYSQFAADFRPLIVGSATDTIDVLVATLTGTLTVGETRVWAVIIDVSDAIKPGLVALGS